MPVPKIEAVSKIKISPDALTRVISNIEKISEHVTIDSNAERLVHPLQCSYGIKTRIQIHTKT